MKRKNSLFNKIVILNKNKLIQIVPNFENEI